MCVYGLSLVRFTFPRWSMRTTLPSPVMVTMSMTPSLSTSPRAGAEPMKPTEAALALGSVQSSCPLEPLSIRSWPVKQVLGVAPLQPQQFVSTSPEMKTIEGESFRSILPSQLVSYIRPTVGVDQTSVPVGSVWPHVHFTFALSGPPGGGWYSHCSMHVPPSGAVPASFMQVGGSGRQRPLEGRLLQPESGGGAPASLPPRAGSQYWPGPHWSLVVHGIPGVTQAPKRHTLPPVQHAAPQTCAWSEQHTPPTQTPPGHWADVVHAPLSGVIEGTSENVPSPGPPSPPPPGWP
jgi:hypothetical protein